MIGSLGLRRRADLRLKRSEGVAVRLGIAQLEAHGREQCLQALDREATRLDLQQRLRQLRHQARVGPVEHRDHAQHDAPLEADHVDGMVDRLLSKACVGGGCGGHQAACFSCAAAIRSDAMAKYLSSRSMPMNCRPVLAQATPVVPDPMQLSSTVSPSRV